MWLRLMLVQFMIMTVVAVQAVHADEIKVKVDIDGSQTADGQAIHLELIGKSYTQEAWIEEIAASATATDDEKFIMRMLDVYKQGSSTDMYELWPLDERSPENPFTDPAGLARMHARYQLILATAFLAKVEYKEFTVFFIQISLAEDPEVVMVYPVVKRDGRYYKTRLLDADPVFQYLLKQYSGTLPRKKRLNLI